MPTLNQLILRSVAGFFGHLLGSEGTAIMTKGTNLLVLGFILLCLIFLFRFYCFKFKYNTKFFLFLYISLLSFFFHLVRISFIDVFWGDLFSFLGICTVVSGGGQPLPPLAPASSGGSSGWTNFDEGVLLEDWPQGSEGQGNPIAGNEAGPSHPVRPNVNLGEEASLRGRILQLEKENSIFLLDKARGEYFEDIRKALHHADSQTEYWRLLNFEKRDLAIREAKHLSYSLFKRVLSEHSELFRNAPHPNPEEAILSFFEETREELQTEIHSDLSEVDHAEINILKEIAKDINDPSFYYIYKILGYFDQE